MTPLSQPPLSPAPLSRLFSEGFRVFFLSAGLFAVLSMVLWAGWIAGIWPDLPPAIAPQHWHAHEMVFGFGGAALAGFFLTAVPNWTGRAGAPQRFIATVWGVWLAGRLALWASGLLPVWAVALADLSFGPVLALQIGAVLLRRPKAPQLIFLGMLTLFWGANLLCHLEWLGLPGGNAALGIRAGLMGLAAMIVILGGRVTPGFTRNAMVAAGREAGLPRMPAPLAALSIAAAIGTVVATLADLPAQITGAVAVLAGGAALLRLSLWQGLWTRSRPILWTLHLAYGLNALGLALIGLAAFGLGSEVAALHVLAIGGIGGMTLAVMSRASLGHTGRALVAPRPVALAYLLLPLAMLARWSGLLAPDGSGATGAALLAAALWCLAFGLFVQALWPAWWQPRLPRAPVGQPPA